MIISISNFVVILISFAAVSYSAVPNARPSPGKRKFVSTAVESLISSMVPRFIDPDLATIFSNCLPNTLDTTVNVAGSNDSFIITGDIAAMWLRDSTNQLAPYLQLAADYQNYFVQDTPLQNLLRGAVLRQLRSVLIDSYANAFNVGPNDHGHQTDKRIPPMTPPVFEGKYELDSIAAVLKMSHRYWVATKDNTLFQQDPTYLNAIQKILETIVEQQKSTKEDGSHPSYTFKRGGEVYPNAPAQRCGLSKCGFRPSDDRTSLPFLIPANAMAAVELKNTANLLSTLQGDRAAEYATRCNNLSSILKDGIEKMGKMGTEKMYAYEVDGFGKQVLFDDANIPSLLSLPYLGYVNNNDSTYTATRSYLLSPKNPYFYEGTEGSGIGSPHTPKNYIWPMAVSLQAITSVDDDEIKKCLHTLKNSAMKTGLMHESFDKDDATHFTRKWFAWANSLFGELILKLAKEKPNLIFKNLEY